jgi:CO/xanthine dehydrogenase FAD-binding subunit
MKTRFHRPQSLAEALRILGELGDAAWPFAGGTDLALQIRMGRREPRHLVGLADAGLDGIGEEDGALVIGATAPLKAIMAHEAVQRRMPSLVAACGQIGGPPVQTVATLGGNLGNASPAADSVPPLLVDDAIVRLASAKDGAREVALRDWFVGPGQTVRRAGELITAIVVPPVSPDGETNGHRVARTFRKYGPRRSNIISAVTFGARLTISDAGVLAAGVLTAGVLTAGVLTAGVLTDVRLAFGSVAPTPLRAAQTETWLTGKTLTKELGNDDGLLAAVSADIRPISDVRGSDRYKAQLALNSVRFALHQALEAPTGAPGGGAR